MATLLCGTAVVHLQKLAVREREQTFSARRQVFLRFDAFFSWLRKEPFVSPRFWRVSVPLPWSLFESRGEKQRHLPSWYVSLGTMFMKVSACDVRCRDEKWAVSGCYPHNFSGGLLRATGKINIAGSFLFVPPLRRGGRQTVHPLSPRARKKGEKTSKESLPIAVGVSIYCRKPRNPLVIIDLSLLGYLHD